MKEYPLKDFRIYSSRAKTIALKCMGDFDRCFKTNRKGTYYFHYLGYVVDSAAVSMTEGRTLTKLGYEPLKLLLYVTKYNKKGEKEPTLVGVSNNALGYVRRNGYYRCSHGRYRGCRMERRWVNLPDGKEIRRETVSIEYPVFVFKGSANIGVCEKVLGVKANFSSLSEKENFQREENINRRFDEKYGKRLRRIKAENLKAAILKKKA